MQIAKLITKALRHVQQVRRAVAILILTALALLIVCVPASPQTMSCAARGSASELLRKAVDRELKAHTDDHSRWMYEARADAAGKEQVKVVVETRQGDVDRLRSVDGQPITAEQQKQEDGRIARLLSKPDEQKRRNLIARFFAILPDAVTASYGESRGELVEIVFRPNRNFNPPSREARVVHDLEGRIWINCRENRLAEIEGHLIEAVKFGGSLIGDLEKGGEFHVRQSEVAPGHWEITFLHVNMRGKALLFKSISVQKHEVRLNFRRVADNWTLADAAEELQRQCTANSAANSDSQDPFASGIGTRRSPHPERPNEVPQKPGSPI